MIDPLNLYSTCLAVDIKWVGIRPSQVVGLGLPTSSFKALTQKDIAVAESIVRAGFIQVITILHAFSIAASDIAAVLKANQNYKNEVQMWLERALPWKIELEALHVLGFTFLTSYLQDCIQEGNFL
ncbi:unnamed protein product [Phytophthora lilii]|uniref:Unnamed protein product n=1 Tax=Phytophthora lilii TaxID=2077276 RepID=A0A9W6THU2_9STRA|nr:unnamed protein product [Phytophthora lilii]